MDVSEFCCSPVFASTAEKRIEALNYNIQGNCACWCQCPALFLHSHAHLIRYGMPTGEDAFMTSLEIFFFHLVTFIAISAGVHILTFDHLGL